MGAPFKWRLRGLYANELDTHKGAYRRVQGRVWLRPAQNERLGQPILRGFFTLFVSPSSHTNALCKLVVSHTARSVQLDTGILFSGAVGRSFGNFRAEGELVYNTNNISTFTVPGVGALSACGRGGRQSQELFAGVLADQ